MDEHGNVPGRSGSRPRVVVALLAGSVVPVLLGKYLLPGFLWWLFGLSCLMVTVGSALLVAGGQGGDAA